MKNVYPTLQEAIYDTVLEVAAVQPNFSSYEVLNTLKTLINSLVVKISECDQSFISPIFACYVSNIDTNRAKKAFREVARSLNLRRSFNGSYWVYTL